MCDKCDMAIDYINKTRGTTFAIGDVVSYTGGKTKCNGKITGAYGGYLLICLDGETVSHSYHPTWKLSKVNNERANDGPS